MKVAVIGGTGFVGSYVVNALLGDGHNVALLVRPGSESKAPSHDRIQPVIGEVGSREAIDTTVADCDAVIYCIGILREDKAKGITFEALQYRGVVDSVDAAQAAGVKRFLLMSANGVEKRATPYQKTKHSAEEYLQASRLEATVFRPSVIFGDPHGRMEIATQLYQDIVKPPIPAAGFHNGLLPSKGQLMMSPVHVQDVAKAFVAALADPASLGRTYELGGPDDLSWTELIRRVADATGRRKWIIPFPVAAMKLAATLFDWVPFFPVTRDQLTMLSMGNTVSGKGLTMLTGEEPRAFESANLSYLHET